MKNDLSHEKAGQTVEIKKGEYAGAQYRVEDWWDKISGKPWHNTPGNPACAIYMGRALKASLPLDNKVLYGKIGNLGFLVHVSELD